MGVVPAGLFCQGKIMMVTVYPSGKWFSRTNHKRSFYILEGRYHPALLQIRPATNHDNIFNSNYGEPCVGQDCGERQTNLNLVHEVDSMREACEDPLVI